MGKTSHAAQNGINILIFNIKMLTLEESCKINTHHKTAIYKIKGTVHHNYLNFTLMFKVSLFSLICETSIYVPYFRKTSKPCKCEHFLNWNLFYSKCCNENKMWPWKNANIFVWNVPLTLSDI